MDFSTKVAKLFANHIRRFLIFIRYHDPNGLSDDGWNMNIKVNTNYIGYTRRHLHQRVEQRKHYVIGKHLKDEHSVRPSNLRENFTILKKCRSKPQYLIFEMLYIRIKKRPKLNTQADSRETFCLIRANHALWQTWCTSFSHFYFCIFIVMLIFSHFTCDIDGMRSSKRHVTFLPLIFLLKCWEVTKANR